MSKRSLVVAACAPAAHSFVPPEHNAATERMIKGTERNPQRIREHVERMLDHHARILERAGGAGAHLAVIPEDSLRLSGLIGRHRSQRFCADAIDEAYDRYVQRVGAVCREYGMHVVGGTMTHRRGRFHNTAIMQDPTGRVIAAYHKTHLPKGEDKSVAAGGELPVFDTQIGKIGMLICWDIVFPEPYAVLALKGAELIIQPTFGHWDEPHDVTARSRAMDWSVPLVVSMWGGCACIIDHEGNFAARTGRVADSLAVAALQIGARRKWLFMNDTRRDKLALRRPELYSTLTQPQSSRKPREG